VVEKVSTEKGEAMIIVVNTEQLKEWAKQFYPHMLPQYGRLCILAQLQGYFKEVRVV
jgi:hypothetical protein